MEPKIKVMLVDRREILREGLTAILERDPGIEVVAKFGSGKDAMDKVSSIRPDIVITEADMPEDVYLQLTRRIKEVPPETKIMVLTHAKQEFALFRALRLGARAYISKHIGVEDLISSVHRVHAGEVIISAPMAAKMIEEFVLLEEKKDAGQIDQELNLSKRELEVLHLVASGTTNKEVAEALFISENTVKGHLSRILEKMNVRNRQQAVVMAMEKGIIKKTVTSTEQRE
ncbi:MAG: response regulator transcription factor [Dehalococcoidia bacterium]